MEILTWDFACALARLGVAVRVVTSSVDQHDARFTKDGIDVITIPGSAPGRYSGAFWIGTRDIFREELVRGVDVVIGVSAAAREVALMRRDEDPQVIMQAHGSSLGELITKWRSRSPRSILLSIKNAVWLIKDRKVFPRYSAVVCVSERVKRELSSNWSTFGFKHPNVTVIRNGINTALFRYEEKIRAVRRAQLGWNGAEIVVCACRLHREKGVKELLDSFEKLRASKPNAKLLIVGGGPELDNLKTHAVDLGISDSTHFTGTVNRGEVAEWLSVGDIFAFTSLRLEGAPLNILEALSVGLPVVVSSDLVDRVPSKEGAWGADPRNPSDVAINLSAALRAAENGIRTSLPKEYRIEYCASEYMNVASKLVSSTA